MTPMKQHEQAWENVLSAITKLYVEIEKVHEVQRQLTEVVKPHAQRSAL